MKQKDGITIAIVAVVAVVAGFLLSMVGGAQEQSIAGGVVDEATGELVGPWSDTIVSYNIITENPEGTDVATTAKVYEEKPVGFDEENGRYDFDDQTMFKQFTASSGVLDINTLKPGMYYVVIEASGYNTEFETISIPDGSEAQYSGVSLADYETSPKTDAVEMLLVGSTTDEDFAFTLVNETNAELSEAITLKVAELSELRGWRAIVTDEEGFTVDTDGDGTFNEGVKKMTVTIEGQELKVFDSAQGVDVFDSNDDAFIDLSDVVVGGKQFVDVGVEIVANTGDYTGADDEVWGEGEGVLSYIKIYDNEGNLFATVDVTA